MRGLLILVTIADGADHDLGTSFTPLNLLEGSDGGFQRFETTKDEALSHLKGLERTNVHFDMDAGEGEIDATEDAMHKANLVAIDALAWPSEPNAEGHYALDSVWALGLDEDGMQYRFVPMPV